MTESVSGLSYSIIAALADWHTSRVQLNNFTLDYNTLLYHLAEENWQCILTEELLKNVKTTVREIIRKWWFS